MRCWKRFTLCRTSFISKVVEKVVASSCIISLKINYSNHSNPHLRQAETALLRVYNDIVNAVEQLQKKGVFLVLLDLSAVVDTVGHGILVDFYSDHIGLGGSVLDLFRSYWSGRTQCISVAGVLSELSELMFSVSQGLVIGPIEFCVFTIPLGATMWHYKIEYHIYADNTQL